MDRGFVSFAYIKGIDVTEVDGGTEAISISNVATCRNGADTDLI